MSGVLFFDKNIIDLDNPDTTITVTDAVADNSGQDFVNYVRDRNNSTGWATTNSDDSANTEFLIDLGDSYDVTDVFLIGNNFKEFTLEAWDGSNFQVCATDTDNAEPDLRVEVNLGFETTQLRLTIAKTMVADSDKFLSQLIVTKIIGQLNRMIEIADVKLSQNRRTLKALSGKSKVLRSAGAVSFTLKDNNIIDDADLTLVETLDQIVHGFLVWLCGGNTAQFRTLRPGYRRRDLYLMNLANEYSPTWDKGNYNHGTSIYMQLVEVI